MTLREVLQLYVGLYEPLPDTWKEWDDIRSQSVYYVMLCFMSEEETWVKATVTHPILIPFYDCEVMSIQPDKGYTLQIWLKYEEFIPKLIERNTEDDGDCYIGERKDDDSD